MPPPFAWPTAAQARANAVVGIILFLLGAAPPAVMLYAGIHSFFAGGRSAQVMMFFPPALLWFALLGYAGALLFWSRRRGVVLLPVRGGAQAAVEVRPQGAAGRGLVVPMAATQAWGRVVATAFRGARFAEASAASSVGEVFFVSAGATLPAELVAWLRALHAASGSSEAARGAADLEEIARAAARDPLAAPPGIEVSRSGAGTAYRFRAGAPPLRGWLMGIALAAASFLQWPQLGIGTMAGLGTAVALVLAALIYGILACGPLTAEVEVRGATLVFRRRRFGLSLSRFTGDAQRAGLDLTGLPNVALRCGGRVLGVTGPGVRGPDAAALAWVAAAIRASAR